MKKILRDNKGSVSALVVISVLLYSIVLTTAFMQASSKRKMQMESQILAKEAYEKQLDNLDEIRDEINGGAGTKVPAEATAETAPYFPDNTFTKKEGTIDTGLVIKDASGNEYVWVVVPRTTAVYKTTGLGKTTFTDADYTSIEKDLKDYTSIYVTESGYSDLYYPDDKNVGWFADETAYNNLKNSMLKSVYENGGFYVGRYEAGIETTGTNRTSNTDKNSEGKYITPSTTPVSKADAYPYTYVTRTQAQNLASNVNSGTKTSSLMFGVQWDLVLAFMHNKGNIADSTLTSNSTTIGNYCNSTFQLSQTGQYAVCSNYSLSSTWNQSTKPTTNFVDSSRNKIAQSSDGNGILVTTGTSETNKVMNIYDIAGNVWEWTLELTSYPGTNRPCARRGGGFYDTGSSLPAAYRSDGGTVGSVGIIGFRVSLF